MSPKPRVQFDLSLNPANCVSALVVLVILTVAASWAWTNPTLSILPALPHDTEKQALASERIDPNTASASSLMRLPGLGPARTAAIIEYRSAQRGSFAKPTDLESVDGIGPATVRGIQHLLDLPAEQDP